MDLVCPLHWGKWTNNLSISKMLATTLLVRISY